MHVPPSYIYIYIFKKAVLSFPKAFNAQGSWSTKFCVYFGEEEKEDLWGKETSAKRLGSFVDGSNGCRLKASNHLGKYSRANASSACGFLPHWSMEDVWVIGVLIGVPLPRILSQDRYHLLLCSPTLFGAYCATRVYFALIDVSGCRECEQNYTTKMRNTECSWTKKILTVLYQHRWKIKIARRKKRREFVAGKLHFTNCFGSWLESAYER